MSHQGRAPPPRRSRPPPPQQEGFPGDHPLLKKSKLATLGTVTTFVIAIEVLLFFLWMIMSIMDSGVSANPLFLPIQSFIFILWLMFAVVNISLMALHAVKIHWTTDDKEAMWHTSDYGNGAKAVIVISIVFLVLFGYPPIIETVNDHLEVTDAETSLSDFAYQFSSGDPLNLTAAYKVTVRTTGGGQFNVTLVTKESHDEDPDFTGPRIDQQTNARGYIYEERLLYGDYYLHLTSEDDPDVQIHIEKKLDNDVVTLFVWFPAALLAANIVWLILLFVLRQRVIKRYIVKEQAKMQKAFTIEEVFLIYKDGRLIAHNARRLKADVDKDILTGMLTAVQNFVAESFQKDEVGVLDEMHYGNFRILIENGAYANMAVVVHGEEPRDMRGKMKRILDEIHEMYGPYLANWDGDTTAMEETKKIIGEITPPTPPQAVQDFVEEVFLFHRDNRFIFHVTQRLGPDVDDELLRETMEYITEKVGPNLNAMPSTLPHTIPYGDWTIILEYSADVYFAALLSGPEPKGFRNQMDDVLEEVEMQFGQVLYQWDGTMDQLKDLRKYLDNLFIRAQLRRRGRGGRGGRGRRR